MSERIVAVGLLTRREVNMLGPTFDRAWPVEEAPAFEDLLRALEDVDQLREQMENLRSRRS